MEARAKAIFKSLEEQSEVVILFDEIDRMILDRDSKLIFEARRCLSVHDARNADEAQRSP